MLIDRSRPEVVEDAGLRCAEVTVSRGFVAAACPADGEIGIDAAAASDRGRGVGIKPTGAAEACIDVRIDAAPAAGIGGGIGVDAARTPTEALALALTPLPPPSDAPRSALTALPATDTPTSMACTSLGGKASRAQADASKARDSLL